MERAGSASMLFCSLVVAPWQPATPHEEKRITQTLKVVAWAKLFFAHGSGTSIIWGAREAGFGASGPGKPLHSHAKIYQNNIWHFVKNFGHARHNVLLTEWYTVNVN